MPTNTAPLSKEEQMLAFIVKHSGGDIGRTQLMKLFYLADYESRRFLGKPVSSVKYVWHHYGPYDTALPDKIQTLVAAGVVKQSEVVYPTGKTGYLYEAGQNEGDGAFSEEEHAVLSFVCRKYKHLNLRALLEDVVYQTEPMLLAKATDARGEVLDMSAADDKRRYELGIGYDELLRRRAEARNGGTTPHRDLFPLQTASPNAA